MLLHHIQFLWQLTLPGSTSPAGYRGKATFLHQTRNKLQLARTPGQVAARTLYFIFTPRENGEIQETSHAIYLPKRFPPAIPSIWFTFPSELVLSQHNTAFAERQRQVCCESKWRKRASVCAARRAGCSLCEPASVQAQARGPRACAPLGGMCSPNI